MAIHLNGGIQQPQNNLQVGGAHAANAANAPGALANARQGKSNVGRVLAAVFSFGISEGVRAIVKAVKANSAPAPRAPQAAQRPQARPAADAANKNLADTFMWNKKLPPAIQAAVNEGLDALRPAFGEAVPADDVPYALSRVLVDAIENDPEEVTPARLSSMIADLGKPVMALASLKVQSQAILLDVGYHPDQDILPEVVTYLKDGVFADMQRDIADCQNAGDVSVVLARYEAPIREHLEYRQELEANERDIMNEAYIIFSNISGISEDTLATTKALLKLKEKFTYLMSDALKAENPVRGDALLQQFVDIANPYIERKTEAIANIAELAISDSLKSDWQFSVLGSSTLNDPSFLPKLDQAASDISVDSLINAFEDPDLGDEDTLLIFQSVALKFQDGLKASFGEEAYFKLFDDPFALENARGFGMMALFDKHSELVDALRADPERFSRVAKLASFGADDARTARNFEVANLDMLVVYAHIVMPLTPEQENQKMAANLTDETQLPLPYVNAIRTAIAETRADFGEECIPDGVNLKAMQASPEGKAIVDELAEELSNFDELVTPEMMKAACKAVLRNQDFTTHLGCSVLHEMAENAGLQLDDKTAKSILATSLTRYPELEDFFTTSAPSRENVLGLFQELPDIHTIMDLHAAIPSVQAEAMERAVVQLAEVTGKAVDDMREELDSLYIGISYDTYTREFEQALRDSEQELPTKQGILDTYNAEMDRFIAAKTAIYNLIPTLTGVQGRPISSGLIEYLQDEVMSNAAMTSAEFVLSAAHIAAERGDVTINSNNFTQYVDPSVVAPYNLGTFNQIVREIYFNTHK